MFTGLPKNSPTNTVYDSLEESVAALIAARFPLLANVQDSDSPSVSPPTHEYVDELGTQQNTLSSFAEFVDLHSEEDGQVAAELPQVTTALSVSLDKLQTTILVGNGTTLGLKQATVTNNKDIFELHNKHQEFTRAAFLDMVNLVASSHQENFGLVKPLLIVANGELIEVMKSRIFDVVNKNICVMVGVSVPVLSCEAVAIPTIDTNDLFIVSKNDIKITAALNGSYQYRRDVTSSTYGEVISNYTVEIHNESAHGVFRLNV